jgi:alpha-beta hydrolase superfamily lysophospholipase
VNRLLSIPLDGIELDGELSSAKGATGMVVFAHGSGSSRLSPRNTFVAEKLQGRGLATFLFDLLTEQEDARYENRFNIDLLAERMLAATTWLARSGEAEGLPLGYFGASTGAAAALRAAAEGDVEVRAVVSRGGRVDMAEQVLPMVSTPTLLIVGERDSQVLALNQQMLPRLGGTKELSVVPGASHLFEEAGALEEVATRAEDWFVRYLS